MLLANKYNTLLNKNHINTPLRRRHIFAQMDAESGLVSNAESGYYKDVKTLRAVFYSPFKGKTDAFVAQYLRNSVKCLNYVYANRDGNGTEASGDGYKYRGRGFLQISMKNQYAALTKATGIDFINNPDWLLNEPDALVSALWYWNVNNLNRYADANDLDAISDIINKGRKTVAYGDANGFEHRLKALQKYEKIFI